MKKSKIQKYIITSLVMFISVLIFTITKGLKDSIMLHHMSVELISTTELYGVVPIALIFTIIYARLSESVSRVNIYYLLNSIFISFFIIYSLFIYPNAASLSPDLSSLKQKMPFLRYIFSMLEGWCYALYYIMSELWGSVMIALMFWQFQNQINTIEEAKKLYPTLTLIGQLGAIAASFIVTTLHDKLYRGNSWEVLFNSLTVAIIIAGIILTCLMWILSNKVLSKDIVNQKNSVDHLDIRRASFSYKIRYVFSSKIFILIIISVICYAVAISLIGSVWKKYVSLIYKTPQEIIYFFSEMEKYRGLATLIATILAVFLIRKFSWRFNALITPVLFFIFAAIFTFFIFNEYMMNIVTTSFLYSSMQVIFTVGAIQNVITYANRYVFFEPAKEMAYMTVDEELRTKGKAIVEVLGGRIGTSSGSAIQWVMLSLFTGSNLLQLSPILLAICLISLFIWIITTIKLSKEINL